MKITVKTTPKIIPPTNEAPSNCLPWVEGAGVVVIMGVVAFVVGTLALDRVVAVRVGDIELV